MAERHFARRYRLDPSAEQVETFKSWSGAARLMFNMALEQRQYAWNRLGQRVTTYEQFGQITELRAWAVADPEHAWLAEIPLRVLRGGVMNADAAFQRFFNGAGYPRFRSYREAERFCLGDSVTNVRRLNAKWGVVWIVKLGWVRFRFARPLDGTIRQTTIRRYGASWYVSFALAADVEKPLVPTGPAIGVDRGVTVPAATASDDGTDVPDLECVPGLSPKQAERFRRLEQQFARQETIRKREQRPMSNRQRETLAALQKLRGRERCRRRDTLNKFTTPLAKNHRLVAIEALKVPNMTAAGRGKHGLNREILARSWGEMRRQLAYKTEWYGSELVEVDPRYTSQTCAECSHIAAESRNRLTFCCVGCGHEDHADHNAARNILARGLNGHAAGSVVSGRGASSGAAKRQPSTVQAGGARSLSESACDEENE